MKPALEKLTSPKPEWDSAFIFIKGMDQPLGFTPEAFKVRWIRDEDILVISIPRIRDPFNPPTEGGIGPNGPVEDTPGGVCSLESYIHVDEITTINFYTVIKETTKATKSTILTAEGENQDTAKEREALAHKEESSKKSKKNPLRKADNTEE